LSSQRNCNMRVDFMFGILQNVEDKEEFL